MEWFTRELKQLTEVLETVFMSNYNDPLTAAQQTR